MSWLFLHTRCLIIWNQFPHKNHHRLNFVLQWKICYQLIFYGNRNGIKFHQKRRSKSNPFSLLLLFVTAGQGYKGWKRTELFVQSRTSSPVSSMNNLLIIGQWEDIWYLCKQKQRFYWLTGWCCSTQLRSSCVPSWNPFDESLMSIVAIQIWSLLKIVFAQQEEKAKSDKNHFYCAILLKSHLSLFWGSALLISSS